MYSKQMSATTVLGGAASEKAKAYQAGWQTALPAACPLKMFLFPFAPIPFIY